MFGGLLLFPLAAGSLAHPSLEESAEKVFLVLNEACLSNIIRQRPLRKLASLPTAKSVSLSLWNQAKDVVSRRPRFWRQLRVDGDSDFEDRHWDILTLIHLETISRLVGRERLPEVLELEYQGAVEHVVDLIAESTDREMDRARYLMGQKYGYRTPGYNASEEAEDIPTPVVTDAQLLPHLQITILDNPFLERGDILDIVNKLPCHELPPELEKRRDLTEAEQARLEGFSLTDPSALSYDEAADILEAQGFNVSQMRYRPRPGDFIDVEVPQFNESGEVLWGAQVSHEKFQFQLPNDPMLELQWYFYGQAQGVPFGSSAADAFAFMVLHRAGKKDRPQQNGVTRISFDELMQLDFGMPVAVIDAGCARNPDLVRQYYRARGCSPAQWGSPDGLCVGRNFGNPKDSARSHTEVDPTVGGQSHGTETAGLIAAETNNGWGMASFCPKCSIVCLKIYDDYTRKLTQSAIFQALNWLVAHKLRISNHSYGGFGSSNIEIRSFNILANQGHIVCISAGNTGCDIDKRNCPQSPGQPFTPAAYTVENILSIGATDILGQVAPFSNTGIISVDAFAPGTKIRDITQDGNPMGKSVSGTSFSSPIACGIAAFVWSNFPQLPWQTLKELVISQGTYVPGLQGKAVNPKIMNMAYASIAAAQLH